MDLEEKLKLKIETSRKLHISLNNWKDKIGTKKLDFIENPSTPSTHNLSFSSVSSPRTP